MKPLDGKRVLVTRARDQAAALCDALVREGAEPVQFPTIEIQPLDDIALLDEVIDRLEEYDWLGLTSVNAVRILWGRLQARQRSVPVAIQVAAVGLSTAAALQEHGIRVDFTPGEYRGEQIAAGLRDVTRRRVLLLRAEGARDALPELLAGAGAVVHDVPIYRTVQATPEPAALVGLARGVDAATFTSASTVHQFSAIVGGDAARALGGAVIACIGPLTAEAAQQAGLQVALLPAEYTVEGLVRALVEHGWPACPERSRRAAQIRSAG